MCSSGWPRVHFVAQAGVELISILLPQPPKCYHAGQCCCFYLTSWNSAPNQWAPLISHLSFPSSSTTGRHLAGLCDIQKHNLKHVPHRPLLKMDHFTYAMRVSASVAHRVLSKACHTDYFAQNSVTFIGLSCIRNFHMTLTQLFTTDNSFFHNYKVWSQCASKHMLNTSAHFFTSRFFTNTLQLWLR